jgi:hypothetical protein
MKTTFYFLLASLFLLPLRLSGQCNVAIPANAIPVFKASKIFMMIVVILFGFAKACPFLFLIG